MVKREERVAVGMKEQHGWRIGVNERRRFRIGPGLPVVLTPRGPETACRSSEHRQDIASAEVDGTTFVHASIPFYKPSARSGPGNNRPGFSAIFTPQQILAGRERTGVPVCLVRTDEPGARVGLAHPRYRHAFEIGIVLGPNKSYLRKRLSVVVGIPEADRTIFSPFAGFLDRLRPERIDPFCAAGNQRNETVLVVIDVKSYFWAGPTLAFVVGAIGEQVVDLPLVRLASIMLTVRKHQQVIAIGRDCCPGFVKMVPGDVDLLTGDRTCSDKTELAICNERLWKGGGIKLHATDRNALECLPLDWLCTRDRQQRVLSARSGRQRVALPVTFGVVHKGHLPLLNGRSFLHRCRQRPAHLQCQERKRGAAIGDKVGIVRVERPRPPASRCLLVRGKPCKPPLDFWVIGRKTRFAQHNDRQSRHVPVARRVGKVRFGSQFFRAIAASPCLGCGHGADRPSAIVALMLQERFDELLFLGLIEQIGHPRTRPEQQRAAIIVRGFCAEIRFELRHVREQFLVLFFVQLFEPSGGSRGGHGCDRCEVVGVRFIRRPAILRAPRAVFALECEHETQRPIGLGRKLTSHVRVPFGQAGGQINDLCRRDPPLQFLWFLGRERLKFSEKQRANRRIRPTERLTQCGPHDHIGPIGMAADAFMFSVPGQSGIF